MYIKILLYIKNATDFSVKVESDRALFVSRWSRFIIAL